MILIGGSTRIPSVVKQRMVIDVAANAEQDKIEKEKVAINNQADQLIFQMEKTFLYNSVYSEPYID